MAPDHPAFVWTMSCWGAAGLSTMMFSSTPVPQAVGAANPAGWYCARLPIGMFQMLFWANGQVRALRVGGSSAGLVCADAGSVFTTPAAQTIVAVASRRALRQISVRISKSFPSDASLLGMVGCRECRLGRLSGGWCHLDLDRWGDLDDLDLGIGMLDAACSTVDLYADRVP